MSSHDVSALIIPSEEPHLSEYAPLAYRRRAFISAFTGSAGTALVTVGDGVSEGTEQGEDGAYLWTDGRYFLEASMQLSSDWVLQKNGVGDTPTLERFLRDLVGRSTATHTDNNVLRIGLDPMVHSTKFVHDLQTSLQGLNMELYFCDTNWIDDIWGLDRPPLPSSPFRIHPPQYAGLNISEKVSILLESMHTNGANLLVLSALDDVAWLFNLRASGDVPCCPVGVSYATLAAEEDTGTHQLTLYCEDTKIVDVDVERQLRDASVRIRPYDSIVPDLQQYAKTSLEKKPKVVWMDSATTNYALTRAVTQTTPANGDDRRPSISILDKQCPIAPLKACKNPAELAGMKQAHYYDGAAMANFAGWLTDQLTNYPDFRISEVDLDRRLTGFRAAQNKQGSKFSKVSLGTIAGLGSLTPKP